MALDRDISAAFRDYYSAKISEHGPTPPAVDWPRADIAAITYLKTLAVIRDRHRDTPVNLLDVGCGYGGLHTFAKKHGYHLNYTGIDIVPGMIHHARELNPEGDYVVGDALEYKFDRKFDYVVCVGILTQKLKSSSLDMDRYAAQLIRKMFDLADVGIAFDIMTNRVNFMVPESYHRSPIEILAFCLSELSNKVMIDHAYERYEFTTYVFRNDAIMKT
jgi:SAM-dependent methyltransferase